MPTSLIAPVVGAGVSFGLSKLFGSKKKGSAQAPLTNFTPTGINAGGLSSTMEGGNLAIRPSAERLAVVGDIARGFGEQAGIFNRLRSSVAPGMSDLRASRLGEIESARQQAVGNLRENLARRRVLGSSFGADALTRAEAEFAGQKERVAAESFLQELELTNQMIDREFAAQRSQFQTGLDELNLEASLAAGLAGKATDVMGKNAQTLAYLNAQEAAGAGKFFGDRVAQPIGNAFGAGAGKLFGSGFGSGATSGGNFGQIPSFDASGIQIYGPGF